MDEHLTLLPMIEMMSINDFEAGSYDSVLNVISLTAGPLKTFTGLLTSFFEC